MGSPTPSLQRLQLGLPGYLIRFAPLAFVPHRRSRSGWTPSPPVVHLGLQDFTPTPGVPPTSPGPKSSSLPGSRTVKLYDLPKDLLDGYGRFRPNKSGYHLSCRYYRGGWHRSYPALIPNASYTSEKPIHCMSTRNSLVTVSRIAKFSRLLRPVGPGLVSQSPSPGYLFQGPYPSRASGSVTPTTT